MSDKTIHVVFQVLNFLSNPLASSHYQLTSDEKLLLLFLVKHKGHAGIYPAISTLAKELQRHFTSIHKSLRRLNCKNLIQIERRPGKSSYYILTLPDLDLSTTTSVDAIPDIVPPLASTLYHPYRARYTTPSVHAIQSERVNNRLNKSERRKKRACPLSSDFQPKRETIKKAQELELTQEEADNEFDKFMAYYQGDGVEKTDWDMVLQHWLIRAAEYKDRNPSHIESSLPHSTIEYYKPESVSGHHSPHVAKDALAAIMQKLKPTSNGVDHERIGKNGIGASNKKE